MGARSAVRGGGRADRRRDRGVRGGVAGSLELRGTEGGYLLVDREDGSAITVTFWASHEALSASEVAAAGLRRRAMEDAQGSVASVGVYEVAAEFGNSP